MSPPPEGDTVLVESSATTETKKETLVDEEKPKAVVAEKIPTESTTPLSASGRGGAAARGTGRPGVGGRGGVTRPGPSGRPGPGGRTVTQSAAMIVKQRQSLGRGSRGGAVVGEMHTSRNFQTLKVRSFLLSLSLAHSHISPSHNLRFTLASPSLHLRFTFASPFASPFV